MNIGHVVNSSVVRVQLLGSTGVHILCILHEPRSEIFKTHVMVFDVFIFILGKDLGQLCLGRRMPRDHFGRKEGIDGISMGMSDVSADFQTDIDLHRSLIGLIVRGGVGERTMKHMENASCGLRDRNKRCFCPWFLSVFGNVV